MLFHLHKCPKRISLTNVSRSQLLAHYVHSSDGNQTNLLIGQNIEPSWLRTSKLERLERERHHRTELHIINNNNTTLRETKSSIEFLTLRDKKKNCKTRSQ